MLLGYVYASTSQWYPTERAEWRAVVVVALLNITIYGACFIWAIKEVAASIGSLSLGVNPIFVAFVASVWAKRPISRAEWLGMSLGVTGIVVASYPFLQAGHATVLGVGFLLLSRFSYSVAAIYFTRRVWKASSMVVNAWHTLIGGLLLLPLAYLTHEQPNTLSVASGLAIFWLIGPIAIVASQLWLYLIRQDPFKASFWLFLCPIVGILYANVLFQELITHYTLGGGLCVALGVYLSERTKPQARA